MNLISKGVVTMWVGNAPPTSTCSLVIQDTDEEVYDRTFSGHDIASAFTGLVATTPCGRKVVDSCPRVLSTFALCVEFLYLRASLARLGDRGNLPSSVGWTATVLWKGGMHPLSTQGLLAQLRRQHAATPKQGRADPTWPRT